jgi:hypothetical protein
MRAVVTIADPDKINFNARLFEKMSALDAMAFKAMNTWGILAAHVHDGGTIILKDKFGYSREVRLEDLARD